MARRRRGAVKTPTLKKKLKKPTISKDLWVNNTKEVAELREEVLESNGWLCEMSHEPIKRPSLDHDHSEPPIVRGVISQHCNTLEGYFRKYFKKYCEKHTDLTISEFLRKMADYFEKDWNRGMHHRAISDYQTKLCRVNMSDLIILLKEEYDYTPDSKLQKHELIDLIVDFYTKEMEFLYKKLEKESESKVLEEAWKN